MRDYANNIDSRMFDYKAFYDFIARELPNNCRIVEVGIADSASAVYLAEAILNLGKTIDKFYWVDNFSYGKFEQLKVVYQHIIKADLGNYIEVIPTDSIKASKMFNGDSLDFVYLDSSHEYNSTRKEIKAWYSKLKDQSILSGHDYNSSENEGVKKAVDETLPHTIKRETIDDKINDHYQEFQPEQFLHTFDTEKNLGVWYVRKRHYFKP